MQKILYILRHAKAERGQDDHERPLAPRGVEEAGRMGEYLAAQHIRPDKVLCSTAVRAGETLAALQMPDARCQMSDKMYLASANEIITLLSDTPESVRSLMLIGHNPGLHEFCLRLCRDGITTFPTCALATIIFNGAWRDIGRAQGILKGFITPKMLA